MLETIETAIRNDAKIDVVKHLYKSRERKTSSFYTKLSNDYSYETPLSDVLKSIEANYYTKETFVEDSIFITKLNSIILEHESTNPFDKLDANQKNDFENIKKKLGKNYESVSSDVNRISDELHIKNLLVAEYLNKSNTSFFISISAVFITIVVAFIQIYFGNKDKRKIENLINERFTKKQNDYIRQ